MRSWKWKLFFPVILITLLVGGKYILWDFPISNGKRVGNLTKISKKGKFFFTKTWEGTIDEGSGDKLTTFFSVKSDKIGEELYAYEGKQVILYYEQHLIGWPRDTNYVVESWKPKNAKNDEGSAVSVDGALLGEISKTLFCSLLGALIQDPDLYKKVKKHIEKNNLYLFNKFAECN